MKGFMEEWDQGSNHRNDGKERIAGCRILHFKSNSRIKVKEHRSGGLCGAQAFKPVFRRSDAFWSAVASAARHRFSLLSFAGLRESTGAECSRGSHRRGKSAVVATLCRRS